MRKRKLSNCNETLLNNLLPHFKLCHLSIDRHVGMSYITWFNDGESKHTHMNTLKMCTYSVVIPVSVQQSYSSCKTLTNNQNKNCCLCKKAKSCSTPCGSS